MSAMPKPIAEAVTKVMRTVDYVQKKGENKFHGYKFAAVGDILAKLQPAMADAGLSVVQTEVSHALACDGAVMEATYEFILAHSSGETWEDRPRHTGMAAAKNTKGGYDDKVLNKCHTAARKYFLLSLFQIPTGEEADADAQEDVPQRAASPAAQQRAQPTHDPATGEVKDDGCHVPVPINAEGSGSDWPGWAKYLMPNRLRACQSAAERDAVMRANASSLAELAKVSAKAHQALCALANNLFAQEAAQ